MPVSSSHAIHVDPVRNLVDVRLAGFFNPEDASWVAEEVRAAILSLGDAIGRHVTLYDASAVKVAPPATIEAIRMSYAMPQVRELWARKVAFVATTALVRRQVARLTDVHPALQVFRDRASALAWLLED